MLLLRNLLREHRAVASLIFGLALVMKALIPAGLMIGVEGRTITVTICADATGGSMTKQIVLPPDGKSGQGKGLHAKSDGTCPFASLAMTATGVADPALLQLALGFILLLGFAAVATPLRRPQQHLRPPLRGPPLLS